MAGNITSDNVGPLHLLNIKRIAYAVRTPAEAFPDAHSSAPSPIARTAVVSAVERFLANRGVAAPAVPAASKPAKPIDTRHIAASVVDRFLNARATPAGQPASTCGCSTKPAATPEPAAAPPAAKPAEQPVAITDFVCESDVRDAVKQLKKIFIGPKTIVTPAARELAAQHDILVIARR
jgi:acetaldehyde dehydrogenase (acetylating)